jgi:polysaccharide export outer membrane protein
MKVHIVGQELPRALIRSAARAVLALIAVLPLAAAPVMAAAEEEVFEYRISPEDVLEISVWKEEDLQRKVIVRPDGGVSFPLAGDIQAAGRTPKELESNITEKLQAFIPDAVVTVSVLEIRGLRIYVTGKVKSPGQYTVGRYIDVLQALTMAGGLTTFADTNDIRIIRREDGREVVYRFNYDDVESGKELQQNIVLRTDDVVVVP